MKFNNVKEIKKHFEDFKYEPEVHEAIEFLLYKVNDVKPNEFEGLEITDFYCNGFFGRRYDLSGSIIINSGRDYITIRTSNGDVETSYFEEGWQLRDMKETIEEWTK